MNTNTHKTKLEEEKKLLEEELASLGKKDETGDWEATPESEVSTQDVPDEGDLADRAEDYEEKSSTLSALESRLNDIQSALSKIEIGTYGVCEICHNKIEEERLEVNPSAKTCMSCMEKVV
ncbi:MAG: TraR/DksA C4-type zinc finger protein [Candidatus Paceibacterota bacterium]